MIVWFAESPWPGIVLGLLLAMMFVGGYLQTGKRVLLAVASLCLVLGAVLAFIEERIVTQREQVTSTLKNLADALEHQREAEVLAAIHPLSVEKRQYAQSILDAYDFTRATIKNNLVVEVDMQQQPPRAIAKFNVVAEIAGYPRPIPRFVELEFTQDEDGQWLVRDYRHESPEKGFMRKTEAE